MNKTTRSAYSLLTLNKDGEEEILRTLKRINNVGEVHQTYGVYGCILYAEASAGTPKDAMKALERTLIGEVGGNGNVRGSLISIVMRDGSGRPIGFRKDPKTGEITYENIPDDTL